MTPLLMERLELCIASDVEEDLMPFQSLLAFLGEGGVRPKRASDFIFQTTPLKNDRVRDIIGRIEVRGEVGVGGLGSFV